MHRTKDVEIHFHIVPMWTILVGQKTDHYRVTGYEPYGY
jgi:hypothetical protein